MYPRDIRVTGNPGQHGLCDLALVLDTNDQHDTHVVVSCDQLLRLRRDIDKKIAEHPIALVGQDIPK